MPPITITVRNNGPLFITGEDAANIRLVDHEGNEISIEGRKNVTLCRCGASTKKPFCDGTHSKIGFKGAEQAREEFDAQQATRQGAEAAPTPLVASSSPPAGAPQQAAPEAPQTAG
jgi:CDGSH-type Zn-finger protein